MIYITGDSHGDIDFPKLKRYFAKRYTSEKDYLIILGDAGIVWSETDCYISDYSLLGPTVLFIDGNHEDFELLNKFPIVTYKGAKCHRLNGNIYHVLRGEILTLNGLSFFCMGGATSIDKHLRVDRVSWWEEENITESDLRNGMNNLEKVNYQVDYVLTHCAPSFIARSMFGYAVDDNTEALEKLKSKIQFHHWYFGHYHLNKKRGNYRCFYEDILEIPCMDEGTKPIKYKLLTRSGLYDSYDSFPYLINRKTGRKTALVEEDLPEWYYHGHSYRDWYYCLKGVTDVAFIGSPFDNHISKDSRIYLHYHGKLKKTKDFRPLNEREWDISTWRCDIESFCLGLEKYSPNLNLKPLKARINLVYDQYNNGNSYGYYPRPFPEIDTPHYQDRWDEDKKAQYAVLCGNDILSEFLTLEQAMDFVTYYLKREFSLEVFQEIVGREESSLVRAFDTGHDESKWIFIHKIIYN